MDEQKKRELAYVLWETAGRPESDGVYFWLEAEKCMKEIETAVMQMPKRTITAKRSPIPRLRSSKTPIPNFTKQNCNL